MKKMNRVIALMGIGLMLGGTGIGTLGITDSHDNMTAQAATLKGQYSRTAKWKLTPKYKYKVRNKKAHTYAMTGTAKHVKLKTNHYLKNYTKKTWTRTKFTAVKHDGKWMVYYYVKSNAKNKAAGWVKLTDMRVVSPKPRKAGDGIMADYDTWFRRASQWERNEYAMIDLSSGATQDDEHGWTIPATTTYLPFDSIK